MIPDTEALVVAYLRATPTVTALTSRIGTRTPSSVQGQWARVWLIDEGQTRNSGALHLVHPLVQIDCYGSGNADSAHAEASLLARTIREAIIAMPAATHTGAVVTAGRAAMRRLPDRELEPARERYIVTCELSLHPTP